MVTERRLRAARVVSLVASTLVSLACGTFYAYSAWAPGFAERLKLSSTQSNLIGTFGNLGMYAAGAPVGFLIDSYGPRRGVMLGAFLMGLGYTLLHRAYDWGPASNRMPWLCLFVFLTGIAGTPAFLGALKTAALNWPHHRGTATAFPLSAYGLSAFFFATLSSLLSMNGPSQFLLLLAIGTFTLAFTGFFFLHVVPHSAGYSSSSLQDERVRSNSNPLVRSKSGDSRRGARFSPGALGTQPTISYENIPKDSVAEDEAPEVRDTDTEETSSLLSKSSSSAPGDLISSDPNTDAASLGSYRPDKSGLALLSSIEFWRLFTLLGLLAGVGLMTINNIGNDAKALWSHYDDSASPEFIQTQQMGYVSVLSIMSFCGRILSGIGSDLVVKKFELSRFWCVVVSSFVFCIGQICGTSIQNPHFLAFVAGLNGLGYGMLFGVFPSIIAEVFGVSKMSQNWGWMTLSPAISGNAFNIIYGRIYDSHSVILPGGERRCDEALSCYSTAYSITLGASLVSLGISLYCVRYEHVLKAKARKASRTGVDARDA